MRRFEAVVAGASPALLTDEYPSTADEQSIHPEIDRPDVSKRDRWTPPVKRPVTPPRYIALARLAEISLPAIFGARLSMIRAGAIRPCCGAWRYPPGRVNSRLPAAYRLLGSVQPDLG